MSYLVTCRQTTYWDFLGQQGTSRVHFRGKAEAKRGNDEVSKFEILDDHDLLLDFRVPGATLYLAGKAHQPEVVLAKVAAAIESATSRWRHADLYLNPTSPETLLAEGYGLLFRGPEPLVRLVGSILSDAAVPHSILVGPAPREPMRLLMADDNWIVAAAFRIEELPTDTSLDRARGK